MVRNRCSCFLEHRPSLHLDSNKWRTHGGRPSKQARAPTPCPSPQRNHQSLASGSSRDEHTKVSVIAIAERVIKLSTDMMSYCVEPRRSPTSQISYIRSEADRVLEQLKPWIDAHAEQHKAELDPEGPAQTSDTSEVAPTKA